MDLATAERLFDKVGLPGMAVGGMIWLAWQLLKPMVNNIDQSTATLSTICSMLSAHNQNALDMHQTCRTHGTYIVDTTDAINDNHKEVSVKLEAMDGKITSISEDVKVIRRNIKDD